MKMKTNVAVQTANDCIRHVLKDAYAELEYKYVKETRKQSLLDRIEHLENVMRTLDGMVTYIKIQGVHTIVEEKEDG